MPQSSTCSAQALSQVAAPSLVEWEWDDESALSSGDHRYVVARGVKPGESTTTLHITGFSFGIPEGAGILGLVSELTGRSSASGQLLIVASLLVDGAEVGDNKANPAIPIALSSSVFTFGDEADRWAYFDISQVEVEAGAGKFGIAVQVLNDGTEAADIFLDHFRFTVYFEPPEECGMTIAELTTAIRSRGIAEALISNADMQTMIAEALPEFSRYRSAYLTRTFDTVADQQTYTPTQMGDADIKDVLFCTWNPFALEDEWDLNAVMQGIGVAMDAGYWHMPSQEIVHQIKAASRAANLSGDGWQDEPGGVLYLNPAPDTSGLKVCVLYTKAHTSVESISCHDKDMFLDLLLSMCGDRIAMETAAKGAAFVKTPEYEVRFGETIGLWRKVGAESRQRFICKAQSGKAAAART